MTLASTEGFSGSFIVNANTHNAPLNLDFISAPLDAALELEAHTSNGGADVRLHPSYEGRFDASTMNSHVRVQMGEGGGGDRGRRHIAIAQNTAKYV